MKPLQRDWLSSCCIPCSAIFKYPVSGHFKSSIICKEGAFYHKSVFRNKAAACSKQILSLINGVKFFKSHQIGHCWQEVQLPTCGGNRLPDINSTLGHVYYKWYVHYLVEIIFFP